MSGLKTMVYWRYSAVLDYSKSQLDRRGWKITGEAPDNIAEKDWDDDVGSGWRVGSLQKFDLGKSLSYLPAGP